MEFVLAFWTRARESLLRILFLERDMISCGNLCFLFKGNYFERGIFVFLFSVGVEREFEIRERDCVGGRAKDGNGW